MKSLMRIICSLLIIIILPSISAAGELVSIHGVKINLENGEVLNGYILTYSFVDSCNKSKENIDKWNSYLENNLDGGTVRFIGKLVKIGQDNVPEFLAAKSSVKEIGIDDIKSIDGVCRKWSGTKISASFGVPEISDYMAEYISNHKMIASYTFDAEGTSRSPEEYTYGQHTTYLSYNPEYPRKRLIKERKIIDKMSDDILDKNKLIRFTWADD